MGIEYISQYSQYWDKERKTLDLMKVSSDRSERKNSDNKYKISKIVMKLARGLTLLTPQ